MIFSSYKPAIQHVNAELRDHSYPVENAFWQSTEVQDPAMHMREVFDVYFRVALNGREDLDFWRPVCRLDIYPGQDRAPGAET